MESINKAKVAQEWFMLVLLVTVALAIIPARGACQTWDEFFSQGAKQKEYDKDQLMALNYGWTRVVNTMIAVGEGLKTVGNVMDGDFNLSRDFFGHLNGVSPEISNSAKVVDIIMFQFYLTRDMGKVLNFCSANRNFTAQEIRYIERVHANFLVLTDMNITELIKIIAPGQKTMTDAERMQAIDKIYEEQLDQQAFVNAFGDDVYFLSRERQREASTLAYSGQFYTSY